MDQIIVRIGGLVIALGLGIFGISQSSQAKQPIETIESIETSTPTPSRTPTQSPTPTQSVTPTVTITPTPSPTWTPPPTLDPAPYDDWAQADPDYRVPWTVKCDDDEPLNGYRLGEWARGFCVPGMITKESQFFKSPPQHFGLLSSYADGVMEAQVAYRGYGSGTEGVALMSCSYMHETVWLEVPGRGWFGPFKVVDCSGRNHMYYHMVGMGLAAEVSHDMAVKMGGLVLPRVNVSIGGQSDGPFVWLAGYWVENVLSWEGW